MAGAKAGPSRNPQQARVRSTTADSFNYRNLYDVKVADKLWVLEALDALQFNNQIQQGMDNDDVTAARQPFMLGLRSHIKATKAAPAFAPHPFHIGGPRFDFRPGPRVQATIT